MPADNNIPIEENVFELIKDALSVCKDEEGFPNKIVSARIDEIGNRKVLWVFLPGLAIGLNEYGEYKMFPDCEGV